MLPINTEIPGSQGNRLLSRATSMVHCFSSTPAYLALTTVFEQWGLFSPRKQNNWRRHPKAPQLQITAIQLDFTACTSQYSECRKIQDTSDGEGGRKGKEAVQNLAREQAGSLQSLARGITEASGGPVPC